MYHQVVNKTCKCCKENLPAAFFYKKEKSADGLQDWCKDCQNKYNSDRLKLQSKRKHLRNLKRLSNYQLRNGLQYKFAEPKKNGHYRNKIIYKCLKCGKEVTSTIETAYQKAFTCGLCNNSYNMTTLQVESNITTSNKKEVKSIEKPSLLDELKILQSKYPNCVISIEVEHLTKQNENNHTCEECIHQECDCEECSCDDIQVEKKGLFNWIKNLFKRSK